ncbi:MAG: HEAT repeat domain-containing protein [bacterium]
MIPVSEVEALFHGLADSGGTSLDVARDLDPYLQGVKLYPFAPILSLGNEIGTILEQKPQAAIEIVLRMVGSNLAATRALACVLLSRLARYGPAPWMKLAHHLAADDNWEVREYAAHIFDTHGDFEGLAAFHPDYCFEVLTQWVQDEDYRVRRATTNALLGYYLKHPEIGPRLLSLLEPLLKDSSDYVRRNLVFALRTIGKKRPELVLTFIETHIENSRETVRDIFHQTLTHRWTRGYESSRDALLKRLRPSSS